MGNELMWIMLITARSLHQVSLVPIHQLLTDSLSHLPAKGEVDVMEHRVSDVIVYASQIYHVMEGRFGESLRSLMVFNLQAEGSGQMCVILSAESS